MYLEEDDDDEALMIWMGKLMMEWKEDVGVEVVK